MLELKIKKKTLDVIYFHVILLGVNGRKIPKPYPGSLCSFEILYTKELKFRRSSL